MKVQAQGLRIPAPEDRRAYARATPEPGASAALSRFDAVETTRGR